MDLHIILHNLSSPPILAFLLGFIATLLRSDLRIPELIYQGISIYLLLAIGIKGGVQMNGLDWHHVSLSMVGVVLLCLLTASLAFSALYFLGRLSQHQSAAIAAHYGSVSAVTFIAASEFLKYQNIPFEGHFPALVALMEVPGIVLAIVLARAESFANKETALSVLKVLTGKSVVLLAGGFFIGFISGTEGVGTVAPFFIAPFKGVLTLFLLEMGVMASQRLRDFKSVGLKLGAFAIFVPLINGILGCMVGEVLDLSLGGITLLGVLAASGSYIAAPAAVKESIPNANLPYCITMSLGITFPLNLTLGIPFFYWLAQWIQKM